MMKLKMFHEGKKVPDDNALFLFSLKVTFF